MALVKNTNIQDTYSREIHSILVLMMHIACTVEDTELLSNRNFMISEAYENLNDSYELTAPPAEIFI